MANVALRLKALVQAETEFESTAATKQENFECRCAKNYAIHLLCYALCKKRLEVPLNRALEDIISMKLENLVGM